MMHIAWDSFNTSITRLLSPALGRDSLSSNKSASIFSYWPWNLTPFWTARENTAISWRIHLWLLWNFVLIFNFPHCATLDFRTDKLVVSLLSADDTSQVFGIEKWLRCGNESLKIQTYFWNIIIRLTRAFQNHVVCNHGDYWMTDQDYTIGILRIMTTLI